MQTSSPPALRGLVWRTAAACSLLSSTAGLFACGNKAPQEGRVETLEALNAYDAQSQGAAARKQTPVSGHVFLLARVPGAHVALWAVDAESGARLHRLATTNTLDDGSFALDAGTYEGPALLEAKAPATLAVLSLALREVGLGAAVTDVVLTPVTTVMAAYAGFRAGTGVGWQRAVVEAETSLNEHFFAIDHTRIVPAPWPSDAGQSGRTCDLDQAARRASLVARGLAVLADARLSRSASPQPDAEALGKLLAFVTRDVAADGLVDGRPAEQGPGGPYVQVAPEVLRDGLAGAIASFLDSPSNYSGCKASDAQSLLDHLQRSNNPPLVTRDVEPPAPLPLVPAPPQVSCVGTDETDESVELDSVLRGPVKVRCRWQATGGTTNLRFDAGTESPWVARVVTAEQDELILGIDTAGIEEHTHRHRTAVTLCGDDAHGQSECRQIFLRFRNVPPKLQLAHVDGRSLAEGDDVAWYAPGHGFTVRATAGEGTSKLQLFIDGKLYAGQYVVPTEERSYDLAVVPGNCDQEKKLTVVATDESGHSIGRTLSLRCLSRAPALQPLPTQYRPDFTVPAPSSGNEGWNEQQVSTLHKLFNRLDYVPGNGASIEENNLPVLRFAVDSADPRQLAGVPKVTYSYARFFDSRGSQASEVREWRELLPESDGTFSLPISYQMLLPQALLDLGTLQARENNALARCRPDDIHEIAFRVENSAGLRQEASYRFRLDLRAPEILVHSFEIAPWLRETPYESVLERIEHGSGLVAAKAQWSVRCTKDTLFPCYKVKLKGDMSLQFQVTTVFIDQWDCGDFQRTEINLPPHRCFHENWVNDKKGPNVAWSEFRGCHVPVKDHFAKNGRSTLYISAKEVGPFETIKAEARQAEAILTNNEVENLSFNFHFAKQERGWELTGGREGCFRLYHLLTENDWHFLGKGKNMRKLSTDYFAAGFAGAADIPPSSQFSLEADPEMPASLGLVVQKEGSQIVHEWVRGENKTCERFFNIYTMPSGRSGQMKP